MGKDQIRPYQDIEQNNDYVIRSFDENIDPIELLWHRDDENRLVEILECGDGWMFQYDNQLPIPLTKNTKLTIHRHQWHRVIKGKEKLLIKIYKI